MRVLRLSLAIWKNNILWFDPSSRLLSFLLNIVEHKGKPKEESLGFDCRLILISTKSFKRRNGMKEIKGRNGMKEIKRRNGLKGDQEKEWNERDQGKE